MSEILKKYGISLNEYIKVDSIESKKNIFRIRFSFVENSKLSYYFNRREFCCIYNFNVENIPHSILIIPFLCNILPILWMTNSYIEIEELDESFANCIQKIKDGYINMWKDVSFLGGVIVNKTVKNTYSNEKYGSILFFSGGVDATAALLENIDSNPLLVTALGADIDLKNIQKWDITKKYVKCIADSYNLKIDFMRSNFRKIVHEPHLNTIVPHTSWYQAFQFGIGLSSLVVPFCYKYGIKTVLFSGDMNHVNARTASSPNHEGNLQFAETIVKRVHNNITRQDKVENIVNYKNNNAKKIILRVCLQNKLEECCHCEKCARTILAILAEKDNPEDFGFYKYKENIEWIKQFVETKLSGKDLIVEYLEIQNKMIKNYEFIKNKKEVEWFLKIDLIDKLVKQEMRKIGNI